MESPMTSMGKSYGFRDSLGGCHQRHRYFATRRSFGPQTGLMAVLRGAASASGGWCGWWDFRCSNIFQQNSKSSTDFLLGLSLKLSLNGSCDIRFPFFLSALLQTLDGSEWMNRTSMILRCLMLVKEKTRSSSWENRQFGRPSKLFAVQCMEGACHRLQPWESVSGAKMSGCSATGYLPIRGWQCLM